MRKVGICLLLLVFACTDLWAWGQKGHRIIGEVAYTYLSPVARRKTDAVLGRHGLVYYANRPDEIKSDTIYLDSSDWHYQDLDAGLTDEAVAAMWTDYPDVGGRLLMKLDSLTTVLKQNPKDQDALWFVVHLMGDLYCPMHTAHLDDKGGNEVKMKWFGDRTNLHTVWDTKLIEARGYSYTEYAEFLIDTYGAERRPIEQKKPAELLVANYHLCNAIYDYQAGWDGNTYHYIYRWHEPMEHQLYTAGVRLAKLLNSIY